MFVLSNPPKFYRIPPKSPFPKGDPRGRCPLDTRKFGVGRGSGALKLLLVVCPVLPQLPCGSLSGTFHTCDGCGALQGLLEVCPVLPRLPSDRHREPSMRAMGAAHYRGFWRCARFFLDSLRIVIGNLPCVRWVRRATGAFGGVPGSSSTPFGSSSGTFHACDGCGALQGLLEVCPVLPQLPCGSQSGTFHACDGCGALKELLEVCPVLPRLSFGIVIGNLPCVHGCGALQGLLEVCPVLPQLPCGSQSGTFHTCDGCGALQGRMEVCPVLPRLPSDRHREPSMRAWVWWKE